MRKWNWKQKLQRDAIQARNLCGSTFELLSIVIHGVEPLRIE